MTDTLQQAYSNLPGDKAFFKKIMNSRKTEGTNMKKFTCIFNSIVCLLAIFILNVEDLQAFDAANIPIETILFKLPKNTPQQWKELKRDIQSKKAVLEYIPSDQSPENWKDLLAIEYISNPPDGTIEVVIKQLQNLFSAGFQTNPLRWNVIEKDKKSCIYESVWTVPQKGLTIHEISRAFLSETGFHRIVIMSKQGEMSPAKRDCWLTAIRESVSLVRIQEALSSPGTISLADKNNHSLDLGAGFKDWKIHDIYSLENGCATVIWLPASYKGGYIDECLEIMSVPLCKKIALHKFFELEKKDLLKKSKAKLSILKQSSEEILYSYIYPHDHLQVIGVVKTFIKNEIYYSINYKIGLPKAPKNDFVLEMKKHLDQVK